MEEIYIMSLVDKWYGVPQGCQEKEQWSWQENGSTFLLTLCVSMAESLNLYKPVLPLQNNAVFHNIFLRIKHFWTEKYLIVLFTTLVTSE